MKKLQTILSGLLMSIVAIGFFVLTTACEGPEGPQGLSGIDGNGTCGDCHNVSSELKARILQYENSLHARGTTFARSDVTCAPCHTNEGFLEVVGTGAQATKEKVLNPTPPGCRTCHNIHTTFSEKDYALTNTAPVTLWVAGVKVDFGKGNLCANCHQPRPTTPMPVPNGDPVNITNSRFGGHYGSQAAMLAGAGGIKFPNPKEPYANTVHKTAVHDGCVGCHMQSPYGNLAGGHTMLMGYNDGTTPLAAVCAKCHEGATNFNVAGIQTTVDSLMAVLKEKLVEKGIYNTANDLAKTGTHAANVAAAYYNYKFVYYDKSKGVHNPKYTKAILINSIEALQ